VDKGTDRGRLKVVALDRGARDHRERLFAVPNPLLAERERRRKNRKRKRERTTSGGATIAQRNRCRFAGERGKKRRGGGIRVGNGGRRRSHWRWTDWIQDPLQLRRALRKKSRTRRHYYPYFGIIYSISDLDEEKGGGRKDEGGRKGKDNIGARSSRAQPFEAPLPSTIRCRRLLPEERARQMLPMVVVRSPLSPFPFRKGREEKRKKKEKGGGREKGEGEGKGASAAKPMQGSPHMTVLPIANAHPNF